MTMWFCFSTAPGMGSSKEKELMEFKECGRPVGELPGSCRRQKGGPHDPPFCVLPPENPALSEVKFERNLHIARQIVL